MKIEDMTEDCVENIRNGIIEQAANDWLKAQSNIELYSDPKAGRAYIEKNQKKGRRKHTWAELEKIRCDRLETAYVERSEVETFFRSSWYRAMCSLDGETMIEMLRAKYEREQFDSGRKRFKSRQVQKF